MLEHTDEAKLLIVDDLPENLLALDALLKGPGIHVHQAESAEQALELLLRHEFALAILDVQMPGMDGFQLAELMRSTERTKQIPIVFVSAAGRELNYAFKGYESGAVDFMQKPLDTHAVRSKVSVFVDLYRNRKRLARQLEELERSRREQEVLLDELRSTKVELENAVRMRDDFMSIVSHELKTPLNTLILEVQLRKLQLGRKNFAAFSEDKLQQMVDKDERQIQSLIRLIDDMLDVSRIRTGKLSIRPTQVDLGKLVASVVENFAPQMEASGCTLLFQRPEPVIGLWDEFRIEQVLANLLTNAMRYGAGQPVQVNVSTTAAGACIEVRDHGIGISQKSLERIFCQFERAEGSESSAGLGLGLFIAEQIIKAHSGLIQVESEEGKGALFRVLLPLNAGA
ncbi:hybrid sensor histidine kinase/response regulator [Pseudomonas sp. Choline-3u-10]|jgi:signal transduction histidine kinase|uniref:hybrid sensor histidine kinase/response regulator n=1 Tax=Pseudomonadaceae TaxID=135621 RepID=UPI000617B38D|nr:MULTISPECIES: hybrid sensor histidine kinase/response regulator [Pseudomonadaceae]MBU0949546.1 hybrid sensor histidine kinase/response regulator [Gammaproteobacteria bacterium]HBM06851.1 hybrid sensor histidine kinase/response regulator [Pseudomonas sp.]KJJ64695.1 histidine kinase [Pseudomonas sp. 10B238]MBK3793783.1 response regulator [Stutzerimonas stutzeri]MBK3875273.1 response regulator [Stutzerimonas stutzeri]|tara:strand:+ start:3235 stop:4431 length:1197 start_codon:yes stop_codon:yes gene_type:complete